MQKKQEPYESYSPIELLMTARQLVDSGDDCLLRPAILDAITCLEVYIHNVVFKSLKNKLDPTLVDWLEDKTRSDFDTRLYVLTPIATGHAIDKKSELWASIKQARDIRHKIVHTGRKASRTEASMVIETVSSWLTFLASSIGLELALREFKEHIESHKISPVDDSDSTRLLIEFFSQKYGAASHVLSKDGTLGFPSGPDMVIEFGKYRIALITRRATSFSLRNLDTETPDEQEQKQKKLTGRYYLPEEYTHGALVYFMHGHHQLDSSKVRWKEDDRVTTLIINCV